MTDYVSINNDLTNTLYTETTLIGEITSGFNVFGKWIVGTDLGYIYESLDGTGFRQIAYYENCRVFHLQGYIFETDKLRVYIVTQDIEGTIPKYRIFQLLYYPTTVVKINKDNYLSNGYVVENKTVVQVESFTTNYGKRIHGLIINHSDGSLNMFIAYNNEFNVNYTDTCKLSSVNNYKNFNGLLRDHKCKSLTIANGYVLSIGYTDGKIYVGQLANIYPDAPTHNEYRTTRKQLRPIWDISSNVDLTTILYSVNSGDYVWNKVKTVGDVTFVFGENNYICFFFTYIAGSLTPRQLFYNNDDEMWIDVHIAEDYYILSSNKNRYTASKDLLEWTTPTTVPHLPSIKGIGNISVDNNYNTQVCLCIQDGVYKLFNRYHSCYGEKITNMYTHKLNLSSFPVSGVWTKVVSDKNYCVALCDESGKLLYVGQDPNRALVSFYKYNSFVNKVQDIQFDDERNMYVLSESQDLFVYSITSLMSTSTTLESSSYMYLPGGKGFTSFKISPYNSRLSDETTMFIIFLGMNGNIFLTGCGYNSDREYIIDSKNWIDGFFDPYYYQSVYCLFWVFSSDGYMTAVSNYNDSSKYGKYPDFDNTIQFTGLDEIKWIANSKEFVVICDSTGLIKFSKYNWVGEVTSVTITSGRFGDIVTPVYKYNEIVWSENIQVCKDGDIPVSLVYDRNKFYLCCSNGNVYTSLRGNHWIKQTTVLYPKTDTTYNYLNGDPLPATCTIVDSFTLNSDAFINEHYNKPPILPVVNNDANTTSSNTIITGDVLLNDSTTIGTLSVSAVNNSNLLVGTPVAGSRGGEFIIHEDGSYSFDPKNDFSELIYPNTTTTHISYLVTNGISSLTANLIITVKSIPTQSLNYFVVFSSVQIYATHKSENGDYYCAGRDTASNKPFIAKFDSQKTLMWAKTITLNNALFIEHMHVDNTGIYCSPVVRSVVTSPAYLLKLDLNGNLIWSKSYFSGTYVDAMGRTSTSDNNIIFCLHTYNTGTYYVKVNYLTGDVIWSRKLANYGSRTGTYCTSAYKLSTGTLFALHDQHPSFGLMLILISNDGNLLHMGCGLSGSYGGGLSLTVCNSYYYFTSSTILIKFDINFNVIWNYVFPGNVFVLQKNNKLLFSCMYNNDLIFGELSESGAILWSKLLGTPNGIETIAAQQDTNTNLLHGFSEYNGQYNGFIFELPDTIMNNGVSTVPPLYVTNAPYSVSDTNVLISPDNSFSYTSASRTFSVASLSAQTVTPTFSDITLFIQQCPPFS